MSVWRLAFCAWVRSIYRARIMRLYLCCPVSTSRRRTALHVLQGRAMQSTSAPVQWRALLAHDCRTCWMGPGRDQASNRCMCVCGNWEWAPGQADTTCASPRLAEKHMCIGNVEIKEHAVQYNQHEDRARRILGSDSAQWRQAPSFCHGSRHAFACVNNDKVGTCDDHMPQCKGRTV